MADASAADFEIEPLSAAVLASLDHERREEVRRKGKCGVGCREVDERVLMGGLERRVVVGVSSEATPDADFGLRLITRTLYQGLERGERERVLVISTEPTRTVVSLLRDAVVAQARGGKREGDRGLVREVLGLVSVVQVFDVMGVSEVLGELDTKPLDSAPDSSPGKEELETPVVKVRDEIPDSDDDATPSPSPPTKETSPESHTELPDIILITHFSTLLTTLYTHAEQAAVHNTLHLLSSRLRYISRSLSSNPLIILSNSTTPSTVAPADASREVPPGEQSRAPDPSLRSVFSAPGLYATTWQKPSFGLVFAQFLDLHLLCTRIPRTREDAEGLVAAQGQGRMVWVVEVLLDEGGVWEGERGGRKERERRWGVVDVVGGKVVDAFSASGP